MYRHIKRDQNVSKMGAFLYKGKLVDKPYETLGAQYEKVFSTLLLQFEVKDPEAFFAPVYNCMDCDNKITYLFLLDLVPEK